MTTVSPYYTKPTHGTALKNVMEQRMLMDGFMVMVKKKLELDRKHLNDTVELRASWDPRWHESEIGSLVSPMLTYLDDEINHRIQARDELAKLWTNASSPPSTQNTNKGDFDYLELPDRLEELFIKCQQSHEAVNTPEGKAQLQGWYSQRLAARNESVIDIPSTDRAYRKAVAAQQPYVERAVHWYDNDLETIVERHQQLAEDMKKLLQGSLRTLSELVTRLVTSCSSAVCSINAFASTKFISARHEERNQERNHMILRPFDYHSYYLSDEGELSGPLFGLGRKKSAELSQRILDSKKVEWQLWPACMAWLSKHCSMEHILQLERRLFQGKDLEMLMEEDYFNWPGYVVLYLQYVLWSEQPLLPISPRQISQHKDGVPRRKLGSVTRLGDSIEPVPTSSLISRLLAGVMWTSSLYALDKVAAYASFLLTHNMDAGGIIRDICRKWDFAHKCPLLPSVKREVWDVSTPTPIEVNIMAVRRTEPAASSPLSPIGSEILGLVDCRYRIEKKTREENGSLIFDGTDKITDRLVTAIVIPAQSAAGMIELADFEKKTVYALLAQFVGVPQIQYYEWHEKHYYIIITRLGPNLESLLQMNGGTFSLKTVAMCAKEMITRVQAIHSKYASYPNVRLQDWVIGMEGEERRKIYMTNLDFSKPFLPRSIYNQKFETLRGNEMFWSVRSHLEKRVSKADDLELLGYMFVYFLRGYLPWEGFKQDGMADSHKEMAEKKRVTTSREICQDSPIEFFFYLNYVRGLSIDETPDYDYLRWLFQCVLTSIGESDDGAFDWIIAENAKEPCAKPQMSPPMPRLALENDEPASPVSLKGSYTVARWVNSDLVTNIGHGAMLNQQEGLGAPVTGVADVAGAFPCKPKTDASARASGPEMEMMLQTNVRRSLDRLGWDSQPLSERTHAHKGFPLEVPALSNRHTRLMTQPSEENHFEVPKLDFSVKANAGSATGSNGETNLVGVEEAVSLAGLKTRHITKLDIATSGSANTDGKGKRRDWGSEDTHLSIATSTSLSSGAVGSGTSGIKSDRTQTPSLKLWPSTERFDLFRMVPTFANNCGEDAMGNADLTRDQAQRALVTGSSRWAVEADRKQLAFHPGASAGPSKPMLKHARTQTFPAVEQVSSFDRVPIATLHSSTSSLSALVSAPAAPAAAETSTLQRQNSVQNLLDTKESTFTNPMPISRPAEVVQQPITPALPTVSALPITRQVLSINIQSPVLPSTTQSNQIAFIPSSSTTQPTSRVSHPYPQRLHPPPPVPNPPVASAAPDPAVLRIAPVGPRPIRRMAAIPPHAPTS